jgi:hypothetical protein
MPTMLLTTCTFCNKDFQKTLRDINRCKKRDAKNHFCSKECFRNFSNKTQIVKCDNCAKEFGKKKSQIAKTSNNFCCPSCFVCYNNKFSHNRKKAKINKCIVCKTQIKINRKYCKKCRKKKEIQQINCFLCGKQFTRSAYDISRKKYNFCSRSCAANHRNTHKTTGSCRSKLEAWIEQKLNVLYPNLCIFNGKKAINSELDIYIPSLRLAFELNGITHYKPIYGEKKFQQVQENDEKKIQLCSKNNISLFIVDTSEQKRVTDKTSNEYLKIILETLSTRISAI